MPHRSLVTWPLDWLVKRVRDPECTSYWLWPGKPSDRPAARLGLCPPPISSWAVDAGSDEVDAVTNVDGSLKWRDREVSLRLAEQPDGTWFGHADTSYWPHGGAGQIARLEFDALTTDELAALLVSLLAADLVPAPEYADSTVLHRAFQEQCGRAPSASAKQIERLTVNDVTVQLSKL